MSAQLYKYLLVQRAEDDEFLVEVKLLTLPGDAKKSERLHFFQIHEGKLSRLSFVSISHAQDQTTRTFDEGVLVYDESEDESVFKHDGVSRKMQGAGVPDAIDSLVRSWVKGFVAAQTLRK